MVARSGPPAFFCKCFGKLRAFPCTGLGGGPQPLTQAFFHRAKLHLGQNARSGLLDDRIEFRYARPESGRILFSCYDWHLQKCRHLRQSHGIGHNGLPLMQRWH
jgi:hypothetical protein